MDRADVDLRNPVPGARPTPGASVFADPDQVLWRQFAEASTPDVFYRAWLALQCRMITGVTGGVVVLGPPDTGPYTPAAFWPEGGRNLRHLAEVAEKTLVERRGLVMPRAGRADDPSARPRHDVAYPIQVSGRLLGVVALDIAPRQEVDLQWALRQLQWGAAWLETLADARRLTIAQRELSLDVPATPLPGLAGSPMQGGGARQLRPVRGSPSGAAAANPSAAMGGM